MSGCHNTVDNYVLFTLIMRQSHKLLLMAITHYHTITFLKLRDCIKPFKHCLDLNFKFEQLFERHNDESVIRLARLRNEPKRPFVPDNVCPHAARLASTHSKSLRESRNCL